MILLVNQHTVPIFIDVCNAFAKAKPDITLFTGHIEKGGASLAPNIRVIRSVRYNRKSALTRFITWSLFTCHYVLFLIFSRRPSAILVVTNPPFAPIATYFVSLIRKIRYHLLLYDLYPEALASARMIGPNHGLFRAWQRLNRRVFNRALRVITLSESMKKAALPYLKNRDQALVISNWADTGYVKPIPKNQNQFVAAHNLAERVVVMYSGNMGLTHDLESVIEAAALLKSFKQVIFILIGEGGKKDALKKMSEEKQLDNVMFLPYQDSIAFPLAMAAADIGLVTLGTGAEGISVPSKTYINMAAGLCLLTIAPSESELSRIVTAHDAGLLCEPGNVRQVADKILYLIQNPEKLQQLKSNSLKAASHYTPANAELYVKEILKENKVASNIYV